MKIPPRSLLRILLRIAGVLLMATSIISDISWLMFLGIALFGISLFFSPARHVGKNPSTKQFIAYSTLFTIGIILIVIGIPWLTFIGVAVALLSAFFSSQWPASSSILFPLFIFLGGAVMDFTWSLRDGDVFSRTPPPLWFVALLIGAILWGVFGEYRCWYKGHFSTRSK